MPQEKKPKRKNWEGPLGQPIERWPKAVIHKLETLKNLKSEELDNLIDEQVERERDAKLQLLLKHYGIAGQTGPDFMELAKCLAIESVPGFKVAELAPKPVGAPGRWTRAEGAQLVEEVRALKEAHGLTTADALRLVRELSPDRYGKIEERSLRKRYDEAKRRFG